ncbi:MAG: hypothetical protein ACKOPG_08590 [Novosphingobium sp.]
MKFRIAAAAAALLAVAMPTASSAADDGMSYDKLTHCAAFNMLLSQVMSVGDDKDKPENKTQAETFTNQAAALMVVATVTSKKDPKVVQADVSAENDKMIASLSEKGAADKLVGDNLETCNAMGKAAYQAVQEVTKK